EFIISEPGQKLLTFSIGAPGGPEKTTMRRGAILRTIYCDKENDRYRCDPTFNPYEAAGSFVIHDEWTMGIFGAIGQIMKMSFIDINRELSDAMAAIIAARAEGRLEDAENAYATLSDVSHISLDNVKSRIIPTLTSKNILKISAMQNEIRRHFKAQYLAAKKIANGAK
ncbi:MAG: hypothetical protein LBT64_03555, partial [Puniceicoccales bacterium]|nr:hypothetical protein [Puniceicoccales bacterium]